MSDILASWSEENLFYAVCRSSFHCVIGTHTHINWVCWAVKYQQNAILTWYVSRFKSRINENLESWVLTSIRKRMALHSPKTCVYFGSSRSLFSLFWQNMIICVAFFLATMSCRVRHWRRRWRRQHCFRCSTYLRALTSSRSRAYCNVYVKTENFVCFIFGRSYMGWPQLFSLYCEAGEIDRHLCSDRIWQGRVGFSQLFTFLSKHSQC